MNTANNRRFLFLTVRSIVEISKNVVNRSNEVNTTTDCTINVVTNRMWLVSKFLFDWSYQNRLLKCSACRKMFWSQNYDGLDVLSPRDNCGRHPHAKNYHPNICIADIEPKTRKYRSDDTTPSTSLHLQIIRKIPIMRRILKSLLHHICWFSEIFSLKTKSFLPPWFRELKITSILKHFDRFSPSEVIALTSEVELMVIVELHNAKLFTLKTNEWWALNTSPYITYNKNLYLSRTKAPESSSSTTYDLRYVEAVNWNRAQNLIFFWGMLSTFYNQNNVSIRHLDECNSSQVEPWFSSPHSCRGNPENGFGGKQILRFARDRSIVTSIKQ